MQRAGLTSGVAVRMAARKIELTMPTSGLAPTYLQANLIILPSRYANDFRQLCQRNPVPCPLIAESPKPGVWDRVQSNIPGLDGWDILGSGSDIRTDAPRYNVYVDSKLADCHIVDVTERWTSDHVAFLIGCSFSFEAGLELAGLVPRHVLTGRNVPMYRTNIPLCASGIFIGGSYVVSMRPYKRKDIEKVRAITRKFALTHGEPIAWGFEAVQRLGISDLDCPEWGDPPSWGDGTTTSDRRPRASEDEEVPIFWGCGVTTQEAVMKANLLGTVMAHAPGHMLLLDCRDDDVFRT